MKFRFCGDLDVPDWLLKEISTLSKLVRIPLRQFPLFLALPNATLADGD